MVNAWQVLSTSLLNRWLRLVMWNCKQLTQSRSDATLPIGEGRDQGQGRDVLFPCPHEHLQPWGHLWLGDVLGSSLHYQVDGVAIFGYYHLFFFFFRVEEIYGGKKSDTQSLAYSVSSFQSLLVMFPRNFSASAEEGQWGFCILCVFVGSQPVSSSDGVKGSLRMDLGPCCE